MQTITVATSKNYDVIIGGGILDSAGERLGGLISGRLAAVVTDENVDVIYADRVIGSLTSSGFNVAVYVVPPGEASKSAENYISVLGFLASIGMTRADTVVALGGGVVGDLAGFAAATYMRGVHFMQIPTTLLAAVDSSVGGKTAVNLDAGKNLAGAFYQPDIVLCDTDTFKTLPPDIFADGYAEVIKYVMIADSALLDNNDIEARVARCVEIKRDVVQRDERETGERKLLNFGHTVGHAVERLSDYAVSHGSAVAIGMAVITRAAVRAGLCDTKCYPPLARMLKRMELPSQTQYTASALARAALADKKREGDTITLIVPKCVGECVLYDIAVGELEAFIAGGLD